MGPVIYHDLNVITVKFGRDENNGFLQFNDFYTGGNERQLLRDYGYSTSEQINKAILQYKKLSFSTREIANIVGCSQSHVSRTIRKHQDILDKNNGSTNTLLEESNNDTSQELDCKLTPTTMPRVKLEPNLTLIYDESRYILDPYGERITVDEYKEYYSDDAQNEGQDYHSGNQDLVFNDFDPPV